MVGETTYITPKAAEKWGKLYYDEKTKEARLYTSENTASEVIFASYKGRELIDVEIVPVTVTANAKATADGSALVTSGADTIKVMAWNSASGAVPICENIEIK